MNPSSEAETKGAKSAQSSGEGRDVSRAPKLDRSPSRILRDYGSSLDSTESLVALYNETEDEQERSALRKWLCAYRPFFDDRYTKRYGSGVLEEIACLAKIRVCCDQEEDLVMDLLSFLSNQVQNSQLNVQKTVSPLANALGEIDESVFRGNASPLLKIVSVLFSKLDPAEAAFTKKTYPTHIKTFFALHLCLLMIQKIAPGTLDPRMENGFFQKNMAQLSNIIEHQTFFPLLFRAKLIEQCMDRLADDRLFADAGVTGHLLTFLSGCTYTYAGIRKAFVADVDLDSLQKAHDNLRKAFTRTGAKEKWYDEYVMLNAVTALGCKDANACADLDEFFQNALSTERDLPSGRERNLLRYGIVDRLHCVALEGESSEIRAFAVTELMYLGTHCVGNEGWSDEPAVVEAILAALQDVIIDGEHKELAETTLEVMRAQKNPVVQVRSLWVMIRFDQQSCAGDSQPFVKE